MFSILTGGKDSSSRSGAWWRRLDQRPRPRPVKLVKPNDGNPHDIREQYEKQLKDLQEAYGEAMLELRARKSWRPSWSGRTAIDPDAP